MSTSLLKNLQKKIQPDEIYLISKNNVSLNENVADADNDLFHLIEFIGSAGILTLTCSESVLWVDGRYKGIAQRQYEGSNIKLQPSGGDIHLGAYLDRLLKKDAPVDVRKNKLVINPRKWSAQVINEYKKKYPNTLWGDWDLVASREKEKLREIEVIGHDISGAAPEQRLKFLQNKIHARHLHLLSNSEDIAWLLGIRSWDFPCSRGVQGKVLLSKNMATFFSDLKPFEKTLLQKNCPGWVFASQENRWESALEKIFSNQAVDCFVVEYHRRPGAINSHDMDVIHSHCPENILKWVDRSLAEVHRIIKNPHEQKALAHYGGLLAQTMNDAIAYLNEKIDSGESITERAFGLAIDKIARSYGGRGSTFGAITGSGPNGALPHHQWEEGKVIHPGEMLVIDIGYYFEDASFATDMSRTVLAGSKLKATDLQVEIYSKVLKAFLRQVSTTFNKGELKARQLDQLGRSILVGEEEKGFGFIHGTGHGLGINDHELALTISPKSNITLKEGYCYSIEPGLYATNPPQKGFEENYFGVRIEDIMIVKESQGKLFHQSLNYHPFEKRLIDEEILGSVGVKQMNQYLEKCSLK